MDLKTLRALSFLLGTVIGAGIFAIPYSFARAGLGMGVGWLLLLTVVILILHLAYAEVVLRTPGDHQLAGYGEIYAGNWGKCLGVFSNLVGNYGALLAYIIQGGVFLALLFGRPDLSFLFSIGFFFFASGIVFLGLRSISGIELTLVLLLVGLIVALAFLGLPFLSVTNFKLIPFSTSLTNLFLPYGVVFFALTGVSAIPEVEELLRDQPQLISRVISLGTMLPALLYLIFALVVVGIAGESTSSDAISGLLIFLPPWIVKMGAALGVLTISTSFLGLSFALRETYFRDLKFPHNLSWALAVLPPFFLFLMVTQSFIDVVSVTGILTGGLTGILILVLFIKARTAGRKKPAFSLNLSLFGVGLIALIFILGIVYTLTERLF